MSQCCFGDIPADVPIGVEHLPSGLGGLTGVNLLWNVAPTGNIDGQNSIFTLPQIPTNLMLFKDGFLQRVGIGNDFLLVGNVITLSDIPLVGTILLAFMSY